MNDPTERTEVLPVPVKFNPQAVAEARDSASKEIAAFKGLKITTAAEAKQVNEFLRSRMKLLDTIEDMQKEAIGPMLQAERTVRSWFKEALDFLKEEIKLLKSVVGAFELEQRQAQRAAFDAASKAAEQSQLAATAEQRAAAEQDLTKALALSVAAEPAKLEGTSTRMVWKARIVNEGLVPPVVEANGRMYVTLCPNIQEIRRIAKDTPTTGGPPIVPGVLFELEPVVAVRR